MPVLKVGVTEAFCCIRAGMPVEQYDFYPQETPHFFVIVQKEMRGDACMIYRVFSM